MADQSLLPYEALAAVYDRWTTENDYQRWVDFIVRQFALVPYPVENVLELCCGTGSVMRLLQGRGYQVTGVDRSAAMLARARERTASGTNLYELDLPAALPRSATAFDATVCCFDSLNYFAPGNRLKQLFAVVRDAVRPGGLFIYDVNTRHKLETVFGSSHYGDDCDDFAYVWRNRYHASEHRCDFLISLFLRSGDRYQRYQERHSQYWFTGDELAAAGTGFTVLGVTDDYRDDRKPTEATMREAWVLQRD